ncbi:MAG: indole-3-glycerol phosphate synthase TrpC [Acidobacteriota bacterium]|nr:indole-3-glycerol phosphate synthase TrpC [Acidobacteriota bacterium]MDQ3372707.1 indole-3-glycerol phosphate synthase TrpC [Acidobacteriota bacterium]
MSDFVKPTKFLNKILDKKRETIKKEFIGVSSNDLRYEAFEIRKNSSPHRLFNKLQNSEKTNIIAEFKRISPSKGTINADANPEKTAGNYLRGSAAAISVLTEKDFFGGSINDLKLVVQSIEDRIPVLCKDFILDERQIFQAAIAGASVILLIVAAFETHQIEQLINLHNFAENLGLDALVEVHTIGEMKIAEEIGSKVIGVNNRNLQTFEVTLESSEKLISFAPQNAILISESGIKTREDIVRLEKVGYKGFLIGETLMRAENIEKALIDLIGD